jgi:hypothetical protein
MRRSARRRFPVGAEVMDDGSTHVRVWAPARSRVEVVHGAPAARAAVALEREHGDEALRIPGQAALVLALELAS